MDKLPHMDERQFRRVKKLIRRLCANCGRAGNRLVCFHQLVHHSGDPGHEVLRGQLPALYFAQPLLPIGVKWASKQIFIPQPQERAKPQKHSVYAALRRFWYSFFAAW